MSQTGQLDLTFVDVDGNALSDTVDIEIRHNSLPEERRVTGHDARQRLSITGLRSEPQGLYRLEVRPTVYRPVQRFVTILSSGPTRQTILLPIDPDHAKAVFPAFDQLDDRLKGVLTRSAKVKGLEGITGEALYKKLD